MKQKILFAKTFFSLVAIAIVSFAYLSIETDYEKQMKPLMKLKKEEQRKNINPPVYDGEVEPPFPDLNKNDETLEGIDSNHNGIRDDIEIWINRTFKSDIERKAMKKIAKLFLVQMLNVKNRDRLKITEAYNQITQLALCYVGKEESLYGQKAYRGTSTFEEFANLYRNTELRRNYNTELWMLLPGESPSISSKLSENKCEKL